MKRLLFLASIGAVAAAGCSHNGSGLIPKSQSAKVPNAGALAAAYPAMPLPANPIVGEVRRFDGTVAPPNWALCDGTVMQSSANPALAQMLARKGATTFTLPDGGKYGAVIAISGNVPTNPAEIRAIFAKRSGGAAPQG